MIRISTHSRLSFGLVFLTMSAIICAYLIGLVPDKNKFVISQRQIISESLAVLCSKSAENNDLETIRATIQALVERNEEVLSAALRRADGTLPIVAGNHPLHWKGALLNKSTPSHVRVPIYQDRQIWGYMEIAFQPLFGESFKKWLFHPLVKMVGFILLIGFILYRLFLGKVMKQLDPTSVVPPRVRTALDTMVEGVVMLDHNARIVLANATFRNTITKDQSDMTGKRINSFNWEMPSENKASRIFPWTRSMEDNSRQMGVLLYLPDESGQRQTFKVNTTPIIDHTGKSRGVLATFDDVTQLEEKNTQLKEMVTKLSSYSEKIEIQNQKLEYMATRDPLTGCRNRRSFFEIFEKEFNAARRYGHQISCVMFDIDHFKNINDTYGHAAGDDVLRSISEVIEMHIREVDTVGRYGGEEFCIILPHIDLEKAFLAAERFRAAVEAQDFSGMPVTASFGVASIAYGAHNPSSLIDQADQALYTSKRSGRNRVIAWKQPAPEQKTKASECSTAQTQPEPAKPNAPARRAEGTAAKKDVLTINRQPLRPNQTETVCSDASKSGDDRAAALKMVHAGLAEAANESSTNGRHAAAMDDGGGAVQLNKKGGWGETRPKGRKQTPAAAASLSQVAKVLQKAS